MQDLCFVKTPFGRRKTSFLLFAVFFLTFFSVKRACSLFMYYGFRIFMAGRPLNLTPGSYLAAEHEFPWEEKMANATSTAHLRGTFG